MCRQAATNLAGPSRVPGVLLWVPSQDDQLPFISQHHRRNTFVPRAFTWSARVLIIASWDPDRTVDSEGPPHEIRGIRPPAMSHCSRPEGNVLVQE